MAKKAAKKQTPGTTEATPENKSKLKAAIKELKSERDAAITGGDKKKLKAARYKIKRLKLKLGRVASALGAAKAKEKAAEGEGGTVG